VCVCVLLERERGNCCRRRRRRRAFSECTKREHETRNEKDEANDKLASYRERAGAGAGADECNTSVGQGSCVGLCSAERWCCLSENLCVCVSYVDVFEERGPSSAKVRMDGVTSIDCGSIRASTSRLYI